MESSNSPVVLNQIQDRSISASVSLLSLCPSMHLLAVALDQNSVAIYRTTWQRLATIPLNGKPDEVITALTWSVSGAYIAVATSGNSLLIYSVDRVASAAPSRTRRGSRDTDPVAQVETDSTPCSIVWTVCPPVDTYYENRTSQIFDAKADMIVERGLLFVGDCDGTLTIFTSNLAFVIARIRVMPNSIPIHHLHITNAMRFCVAAGTQPPVDQEKSGVESKPVSHRFYLRTVNIQSLLDFWSEIDRISRDVTTFITYLSVFEANLKQLNTSWVDGVTQILTSSVVKPLEQAIFEHNDTSNVWTELYNAFCGARIKGALSHFLEKTVGENGAKELLRSFRVHDDDTEQAFSNMLPLAENVLSRSSEYRGLARLASRFAPIGVLVEDAASMFSSAENLYIDLYRSCCEVEKITRETEAFLTWLVIAAVKAGGEIHSRSNGTGAVQDMDAKLTEDIVKFFRRMTSFSTTNRDMHPEDSVAVTFKVDFQSTLQDLREAITQLTDRPRECISSMLCPNGGIYFAIQSVPSQNVAKCRVYDGRVFKGNSNAIIVLVILHNGCVVYVRHDVSSGIWTLTQRGFIAEGKRINDAVLMSQSLMLSDTSNGTKASEDEAVENHHLESSELDMTQLWAEGSHVHSAMDVVSTQVPNAIELGRSTHVFALSSSKHRSDSVSLSLNSMLGMLSILAPPRRIIIFDLEKKPS